tara:strand:+ start:30668 stop:30853 length:186 start_codon:yes stop_codon:yes gene_type:complete
MSLDPRQVFQGEVDQLNDSIVKLEQLLVDTNQAIEANRILLAGLNENLSNTPEQSEFEVVE